MLGCRRPLSQSAGKGRKVYVRARSESLAPLVPRYEAIGKAYLDLLAQYREELRLICDYLEKTSTLSERLLGAARQGAC